MKYPPFSDDQVWTIKTPFSSFSNLLESTCEKVETKTGNVIQSIQFESLVANYINPTILQKLKEMDEWYPNQKILNWRNLFHTHIETGTKFLRNGVLMFMQLLEKETKRPSRRVARYDPWRLFIFDFERHRFWFSLNKDEMFDGSSFIVHSNVHNDGSIYIITNNETCAYVWSDVTKSYVFHKKEQHRMSPFDICPRTGRFLQVKTTFRQPWAFHHL